MHELTVFQVPVFKEFKFWGGVEGGGQRGVLRKYTACPVKFEFQINNEYI